MIALAVDAGGTSTRAVVVGDNGTCLGYGRSGGGNPLSVGMDAAATAAAESAAAALELARIPASVVDCWLVAAAGGVLDAEAGAFREPMRRLGIDVPPVFCGDALATFCSGTWQPDGYVLVAGTGAIAHRVEHRRVTATADGLGWLLGDDGSGFWIGREVVRAALAAVDGRGPATRLADLLREKLAAVELPPGVLETGRPRWLAGVLETLCRGRPIDLARFAPLAFEATADAVADRIVAEATAALRATVGAVVTPALPGPLVCGGGVLHHNPSLVEAVTDGLAGETIRAVHIVADGLAGVAQLALRVIGHSVGEAEFHRIRASLDALCPAVTSGADDMRSPTAC